MKATPQKTEKVSELKVTLVFSGKTARVVRQQAKAKYLPVTQYLRQLILKAMDQDNQELVFP